VYGFVFKAALAGGGRGPNLGPRAASPVAAAGLTQAPGQRLWRPN
jgi:hypothetical protein